MVDGSSSTRAGTECGTIAAMSDESSPAGVADKPSREAVVGDGISWLSRWTLRWIIVVAGAVLLGWGVSQLWSILLPILLALVLTTVLEPPSRWLERRWRFPPTLAALGAVSPPRRL